MDLSCWSEPHLKTSDSAEAVSCDTMIALGSAIDILWLAMAQVQAVDADQS